MRVFFRHLKKPARLLSFCIIFVSIFPFPLFSKSPSILGFWRTIDEKGNQKSIVKIFQQNGKLYGKIVGLTEPYDKDGKQKVCTKCKGEEKNMPLIGLTIIKGLRHNGEAYVGGTILDPIFGEEYDCRLKMKGENLEVYGFIYSNLVARMQIWIR